jgi:hypothetical protein
MSGKEHAERILSTRKEESDNRQWQIPTYGKRLHAAARKDFKTYWSVHRWWATGVTLVIACVAIVIQILFQGTGSVANLEQTVVTGIVGLAVSLVGNYLISMRRGAEALDTAGGMESSNLRKQIEQLTPPKRTPLEEHHYFKAKAALDQFGELRPEIETALCHLRTHEMLKFSGFTAPAAPQGMNARDLRAYLNLCVAQSLVTVNQGGLREDGPFPTYDEIFTIAPGMKLALDELLYPQPVPS